MPINCSVKDIKRCACGAEIVVLVRRGPRDTCRPCLRRATMARFKARHPTRKRELNQRWSEMNREKDRVLKAAWQKRNPEKMAAKTRRWRKANPERAREIHLAYYARNRELCIQRCVERQAFPRMPKWADRNAIAEIYSEARRLTRDTGIEHHVDHFIPLHGKTVSGLHVQNNLRVLTAVSNREKGARLIEGNP